MKGQENSFQNFLFESIGKNSSRVAIQNGRQYFTYKELDRLSDIIAQDIIKASVPEHSFIGIHCNNKTDTILAILGILKARCVFVPFDTNLPYKRRVAMAKSIKLNYIYTDKGYDEIRGFSSNSNFKIFNSILSNISGQENDYFNPGCKNYFKDDKIYIYFTSGSSGIPKAIVGKNISLWQFINWEIETFSVNKTYKFSQFINVGFDAFLRDIFVPLCSGATICISPDSSIFYDPVSLTNWIEKTGINAIHCVPSFFKQINHSFISQHNYKSLAYVFLSGEKIQPQTLKNWFNKLGERIQLYNFYGTTETTMIKTYYKIKYTDTKKAVVPIGIPIKGARIYIMDENMNPLPKGVIGEIFIRSPYFTHGYYNGSESDKEKFIPNPFTKEPNDIFYKTGDLGRILPDGNIELLGRKDRQVKINGNRVEIEEIELQLLQNELINEVYIDHKVDKNGNDIINCYYVAVKGVSGEQLRTNLQHVIPDYMIPHNFIRLDSFPLTPNGKIDRSALPDPDRFKKVTFVLPRNETEKELVKLWSEILEIEKNKISILADFFDLGGNSLKVNNLILKVHKRLRIKLRLNDIFEYPTIAAISNFIQQSNKVKYNSITLAEKREFYKLSSAQSRIYLAQVKNQKTTSYNNTSIVWLIGSINISLINEIFERLITRHEILRTNFIHKGNTIIQKINAKTNFKVKVYHKSINEIKDFVYRLRRPFNLDKDLLIRVFIIKTEEDKHLFMLDLHHIISDAISQMLIIKEFIAMYSKNELPEINLQYKDYSNWQNRLFDSGLIKTQENYWHDLYKHPVPELKLPVDFERPQIRNYDKGDDFFLEIENDLFQKVKMYNSTHGTTLFMFFLSIYLILISKYTKQNDITIGTPVTGRNHADLNNVMGVFINMLALRNKISNTSSFNDFSIDVKNNTIKAFENQDYQFESLIELLGIKGSLTNNPLFDTEFSMNIKGPEINEFCGIKVLPYEKLKFAKYDLHFMIFENKETLSVRIRYSTELFKKTTIQTMAKHYEEITKQVLSNTNILLNDIKLSHSLSETETKTYEDLYVDDFKL